MSDYEFRCYPIKVPLFRRIKYLFCRLFRLRSFNKKELRTLADVQKFFETHSFDLWSSWNDYIKENMK